MKPHKHAELIKAWADGAEIQWRDKDPDSDREWRDTKDPWFWNELNMEFRIKPETEPDVVMYARVDKNKPNFGYYEIKWALKGDSHIKIIIDGKTGEPKSAEVINVC